MAWVKFNRDFPWKPTSQSTVFYSAGSTYNVKAEVAETAIRKGAAVKMEKKTKAAKPVEAVDDGSTSERG
jgi:hypothetical protein